MHFGTGLPSHLSLFDNQIKTEDSCKYLRLYIDRNLRFTNHIAHVVQRLNKFSDLMYKVRHLHPIRCLLMFYHSNARSIISYILLVYGSAAKTIIDLNEKAQRRILRAVFQKIH